MFFVYFFNKRVFYIYFEPKAKQDETINLSGIERKGR